MYHQKQTKETTTQKIQIWKYNKPDCLTSDYLTPDFLTSRH